MFWLLVKIRILSLWNVARHYAVRRPLLSAALSTCGLGVFAAVYFGFTVFLGLVRTPEELRQMVYEVFYFLFLFLLAGAVPFVASTLLHSQDYQLLSAAPVKPRAIVAAKLLDATVTNSLQFTVIGVPAIVACAAALGVPAAAWPAVPLLIALFVLLPALITALLLLLALAALGMRRVRGAITAVNGVMAAVVCLTIVSQTGRLQLQRGLAGGFGAIVSEPSSQAKFGPSGLFAWALIQLSTSEVAQGAQELAGLALLTGLLYLACMQWGGRLISAAALAEEGEGSAPTGQAGRLRHNRHGLMAVFSAPVAALIAKDFKYLLRDSVLLSQLAMPVILFFVPFVLALQQETLRLFSSPPELYPFSAAMVGIIVFMQTSILSLSSIGLESRGFWLVLCSPNGGARLLWAKFVMSTLVSAGVGAFLTALSAFVFRAGVVTALVQMAIIALCAAGLCGLGVGISAALPRFVYENPAHRVSVWALILGFFATVIYMTTVMILGALTWHTATILTDRAVLIYALGAGIFVCLSLAAILIPMLIGARRIDVYQWEH